MDKVTQGTDSAHFTIDTNNYADKKISDKFDVSGKICSIDLILRKGDGSIPFRIKIGETVLYNEDFVIRENYSWELSQTIASGNCNRNYSQIEFKQHDVFEVEQNSENIWRVVLWLNELNGKSFSTESEQSFREGFEQYCFEQKNQQKPEEFCSSRRYNFKKGMETCPKRDQCKLYLAYSKRDQNYDLETIDFKTIRDFRGCNRHMTK